TFKRRHGAAGSSPFRGEAELDGSTAFRNRIAAREAQLLRKVDGRLQFSVNGAIAINTFRSNIDGGLLAGCILAEHGKVDFTGVRGNPYLSVGGGEGVMNFQAFGL